MPGFIDIPLFAPLNELQRSLRELQRQPQNDPWVQQKIEAVERSLRIARETEAMKKRLQIDPAYRRQLERLLKEPATAK